MGKIDRDRIRAHAYLAGFGVVAAAALWYYEHSLLACLAAVVAPHALGYLLVALGLGDWFHLPGLILPLAVIGTLAYQDYQVRKAFAAETAVVRGEVLPALEARSAAGKPFPARLEDLGLARLRPEAARRIALDATRRTVEITLAGGPHAGKRATFSLTPTGWQCAAEIPKRQLPRDCSPR